MIARANKNIETKFYHAFKKNANTMIHVRFEGRSYDLTAAQLNLNGNLSDKVIKRQVATFLDVRVHDLREYVLDRRPDGTIIIRPEAVYG